jgi:hypothetical protein
MNRDSNLLGNNPQPRNTTKSKVRDYTIYDVKDKRKFVYFTMLLYGVAILLPINALLASLDFFYITIS